MSCNRNNRISVIQFSLSGVTLPDLGTIAIETSSLTENRVNKSQSVSERSFLKTLNARLGWKWDTGSTLVKG